MKQIYKSLLENFAHLLSKQQVEHIDKIFKMILQKEGVRRLKFEPDFKS